MVAATRSAGFMSMGQSKSGAHPICTHPLIMRHMKSSTDVTPDVESPVTLEKDTRHACTTHTHTHTHTHSMV